MKPFSPEVIKNLDLDDIFGRIVVHTPYGESEKKAMTPFGPEDTTRLIAELDNVERITELIRANRYAFVDMRGTFSRVKDLRGTFLRLKAGEVLVVTELFEVKMLSLAMKKLSETAVLLKGRLPLEATVQALPEVDQLLDPAGVGTPTFYIYDDYAEELRGVRARLRELEDQIMLERKRIRAGLEERLGVKVRPSGELAVGKDDRALIERLNAEPDLVYSAETYVNITYRLRGNDAIDHMCSLVEDLRAEEESEEFEVRKTLSQALRALLPYLEENVKAIGRLDLLAAKGYFAIGFDCVRPDIIPPKTGAAEGLASGVLEITEGRHLKVEQQIKKAKDSGSEGGRYTAVSLGLTPGVTCITGANMGGKTVTLKMVGMLTAVAQYGLFVPAKAMRLTPRAFIYTSIGDLQDVDQGLSTFGAEILKVSEAVKLSAGPGLILIDELARGTNPKEGFAISMAIVNHLKRASAMTLITTHFDGLADARDVRHLQVLGLSFVDFKSVMLEMENDPGKGIELLKRSMDYRLKEIHSPEEVPKDAIQIAALMGLDERILAEARKVLVTPRN